MFRTLLNQLSLNYQNISLLKIHTLVAFAGAQQVDKKYLREFRCPVDNKLLAKGYLQDSGSILEAKCKGCGTVSYFKGEDKEILITRQELLQEGKIPDTE